MLSVIIVDWLSHCCMAFLQCIVSTCRVHMPPKRSETWLKVNMIRVYYKLHVIGRNYVTWNSNRFSNCVFLLFNILFHRTLSTQKSPNQYSGHEPRCFYLNIPAYFPLATQPPVQKRWKLKSVKIIINRRYSKIQLQIQRLLNSAIEAVSLAAVTSSTTLYPHRDLLNMHPIRLLVRPPLNRSFKSFESK